MITNEYFKGYFSALNTLEDSLEKKLKEFAKENYYEEMNLCNDIIYEIKSLRKSYQDLIVELNEKNKK